MKKYLLSAVGILALGSIASAADLPVKSAAPVVVRPACAQFGGVYAGINAGWANLHSDWVDGDNWIDNFGNDFNSSHISNNKGGGTVGGQVGYNWQVSPCVVFGVELDANWVGISDTRYFSPADGGTALTLQDRMRWFGTARTRAGVVVDNLLIYATGGFAYANIKHTWTITDPAPAFESFSSGSSRWGGVIGFGTEWAFNRNWSLKSEALYIQFADKDTTVFSPSGAQNVRFESQDWMWVARMGLNYRW